MKENKEIIKVGSWLVENKETGLVSLSWQRREPKPIKKITRIIKHKKRKRYVR